MLRWAVNAGRYEGAKAEKAVPFPGVAAHRSSASGSLRAIAARTFTTFDM